jgi:prepilin-type N-terminal cleavage/methylation domain-containing protein
MSSEFKVRSQQSAAGMACRVPRHGAAEDALRAKHESPITRRPVPDSSLVNRPFAPAFTLIEIMIVVAIMAIVMTMSVPIVYKVWHKAPLRKAVSDVVEVLSRARAQAIMQGVKAEVVFHPRAGVLAVGGGSVPRPAEDATMPPAATTPAPAGSGLSAQLSDRVIIETMDINMSGIEYNDAESAKITFYPNGTSDELRMILFDGKDRVGIELEITTGLAGVVPNPLQEWSRR